MALIPITADYVTSAEFCGLVHAVKTVDTIRVDGTTVTFGRVATVQAACGVMMAALYCVTAMPSGDAMAMPWPPRVASLLPPGTKRCRTCFDVATPKRPDSIWADLSEPQEAVA